MARGSGPSVVYLSHYQLLPEEGPSWCNELMAGICSPSPLVPATVARMGRSRASGASKSVVEVIRDLVNVVQPVKHMDETGLRVKRADPMAARRRSSSRAAPSTGSRPGAAACSMASPASSCTTDWHRAYWSSSARRGRYCVRCNAQSPSSTLQASSIEIDEGRLGQRKHA